MYWQPSVMAPSRLKRLIATNERTNEQRPPARARLNSRQTEQNTILTSTLDDMLDLHDLSARTLHSSAAKGDTTAHGISTGSNHRSLHLMTTLDCKAYLEYYKCTNIYFILQTSFCAI
jgi:hypothetical protein